MGEAGNNLAEQHGGAAELEPSHGPLWLEFWAVVAVGIFPSFLSAVVHVVQSPARLPYWLEALYLTFYSLAASFVVLYIIHRSGEPWSAFGLVRPTILDALFGIILCVFDVCLWMFVAPLIPNEIGTRPEFSAPISGPRDYALMLIAQAANGFSEELICRAYLVTRLVQLLRSPAQAIVIASLLFTSYHIYYGPGGGLLYIFVFAMFYCGFYLVVRRVWPFAIGHMLLNILIDVNQAQP